MTVSELIAKLLTMPEDADVLFDIGEEFSGVTEVQASDPQGAAILRGDTYLYEQELALDDL